MPERPALPCAGSEHVWTCKIGFGEHLPPGSDLPMREGIAQAFEELCGGDPDFIFSGWGGSLTVAEQAVVDNREPDPYVVVAEYERLIAHYTQARDDALNYARSRAEVGDA